VIEAVSAPALHLELIETEPCFFTVIWRDRFAANLCRDEALGAVAAALFSGQRVPFLRTYEEWTAWNRRYCPAQLAVPAGLLTMRVKS
jgi:hypothetical protein